MASASLRSRPPAEPPLAGEGVPGLHRIGLGTGKPALLRVPEEPGLANTLPLALMLHGSGGNPEQGLSLLEHAIAADARSIVLAPASSAYTWDLVLGTLGPDVAAIDLALKWVFERFPVDRERIAIGGFSDGASYALSLGLANGDLFTHLIALSPGFIAPLVSQGRPRIFVSHGVSDAILPVDQCSRRIVPLLEQAGYAVEYLEFAGRHEIPRDIARAAGDWFLKRGAATRT